ncbi:MAG: DUF429 domain-containing protein [bacterium]|nr:DUF429 domain-containing protein [bacterium]
MPSETMATSLVAGVDGVRGGWVMAVTAVADGSTVEFSAWPVLGELWAEARARDLLVVGFDMPVGLPGAERRTADIAARELLEARRSSLFWTPPLCTLDAHCAVEDEAAAGDAGAGAADASYAAGYAQANRRAREQTGWGLSRQTFALMPKIRELRDALAPEDFAPAALPRAAEVHPESSFVRLAEAPMASSKHKLAGLQERSAALAGVFCNIAEAALLAPLPGPCEPGLDDLLDAAAAAWTARRIVAGEAECLGAGEHDETGYPMHIWV